MDLNPSNYALFPPSSSASMANNAINNNQNGQHPMYGLNPEAYIRQQRQQLDQSKSPRASFLPSQAQRSSPAIVQSLLRNPFGYYYGKNGVNEQYLKYLENRKGVITGSLVDSNKITSSREKPPAIEKVVSPARRQVTDTQAGNVDSPVRNNRNLGGGLINAGQGLIDPAFGGLGSLGVGGLGALGLGAFGNRFSGINGLLGSQQALVAFALLQPGPEGLPLPENFLFSLPGSISPFAYFRNRIRENTAWFISVQTLVGIGFALNVLGFVLGIVYLCTYFTKMGKTLGKIAALLLFLAACFELLGICVFIAKVRLDRNAFFQVDPAFVIHSGVGWAFYVSLAGAILLLIISLLMLWESSTGY